MKKYKCHKIVEAGEIDYINAGFQFSDGAEVVLKSGDSLALTQADHARIGAMITGDGYLVRYEDGYLSWSPKAVFEAGYTEIE